MPFPREIPKKRVPFNNTPPLVAAIALGVWTAAWTFTSLNTNIFPKTKTSRSLLGPDHPITILEEAEMEADRERRRIEFLGLNRDGIKSQMAYNEAKERVRVASGFSDEKHRQAVIEATTK